MNEINLLFDFKDGDAATIAAPKIRERLSQCDIVEKVVRARPMEMRMTGLEIAAAVMVTANVIQSGTAVVENMQKLVKAIRALMVEFRDLKNVYVDTATERVAIDRLDGAKLQELAKLH
jgi:hypothetical protein